MEEPAQTAGRLASWALSWFPVGDLGMSGLLQALSEPESGGGRQRPSALDSPPFLQQGQTRQGLKEATRALSSESLHPSRQRSCTPALLQNCPQHTPFLYQGSPAPRLRSGWASFQGAVPPPPRRARGSPGTGIWRPLPVKRAHGQLGEIRAGGTGRRAVAGGPGGEVRKCVRRPGQ